MNDRIEVLRGLDELVEAARLLGATQAKKGFGCYTDEDSRFERAMHESIAKHRAALEAALPMVAGEAVGYISGEPKRVHQFNEPVYWLYTLLVEDSRSPAAIGEPVSLPPGTKLYTTPQPSAVLEVVGWLHEVVWEDGTAYSFYRNQPGLLGPRPGLVSERIGRAAFIAAAPEPGEAAGGQRLRPLLDPGPEPMNDNRNTPNCELCRQALRSALGDGPALPLDAVGIQGDTQLCIGCGQSLPGQPAAPEPGEVDSD